MKNESADILFWTAAALGSAVQIGGGAPVIIFYISGKHASVRLKKAVEDEIYLSHVRVNIYFRIKEWVMKFAVQIRYYSRTL